MLRTLHSTITFRPNKNDYAFLLVDFLCEIMTGTAGDSYISLRQEIILQESSSYFFFMAFSAALVVLPPLGSALVTLLMTPTATVCFMSRTAKRPRGA